MAKVGVLRKPVARRRGQGAALMVLLASLAAATPALAAQAPSDPAPPTSRDPADLLKWLDANIASAGWEIADMSRDEALFVQPKPSAGPRPGVIRALIRWEAFSQATTEHPWRSALQMLEIDCPAHQFRELSWVAYSGSNFADRVVANDQSAGSPWRPAETGSIVATAVDLSCTTAGQGASVSRPSR